MTILTYLRFAVVALLCGLWFSAEPALAARPPSQPNIIIMMADDLGWGDVGYNGHPKLQTPFIDELSETGVRFDRFYAAAPVCSPTRGSVLTGRHPFRYRIWSANVGHLPTREVTLAEILRRDGYTTGFFGKWHLGTLTIDENEGNRSGPLGFLNYSPPQLHGFEEVLATESKVPTYDPHWVPSSGAADKGWWTPLSPEERREGNTHYRDPNGDRVRENLDGDDSAMLIQKTINFAANASQSSKPFFAVVWFHAPHTPLVAGREMRGLYPANSLLEQSYYGSISAMDSAIGQLRNWLVENRLADNTIIWFMSDNGPTTGKRYGGNFPGETAGLQGHKGTLWEGGIRVPSVLIWPAAIRPKQIKEPVSTVDVLPTLLGLVGIDGSSELGRTYPLDGTSWAPHLRGLAVEPNRGVGFEFRYQLAWMRGRWKLLHLPDLSDPDLADAAEHGQNPFDNLEYRLFDVEADPSERRDLAILHSELVNQLKGELTSWRQSVARSSTGADYELMTPGKRFDNSE